MLLTILKHRLTAIKKSNFSQLIEEAFRYIGVPGVYIPNKNLPAPYRIKNPIQNMANY
jgi:hypothetical protein